MNNRRLVSRLNDLGLTEYEAKAYLTLYKHGAQEGREVSKKSGIPPTRVYDALKSLVDKGLASLIEEKPMIFKPIEEGIKHFSENKIERIKKEGKEAEELLRSIQKPQREEKVHEKVTTVLGFKKMYNLFTSWQSQAQSEVNIFSVGEEVPYSIYREVKKSNARGVKNRLIVTKYDKENEKVVKKHKKMGFEVKYLDLSQEYTFSIVDKKKVMFNVRNPKNKEERISIFFDVPGLARAMNEYFNSLWERARTV